VLCGETAGTDALLNVLLFVPLGALLVGGRRQKRAVVVAALLSSTIEVLQFHFISGRSGNIADVVANTTGAWLGAFMWSHRAVPSTKLARRLVLIWQGVYLAFLPAALWLIRTNLPRGQVYAQTAATLGPPSTFHGKVLRTTVNDGTVNAPERFELSRRDAIDVGVLVAVSGPPPETFVVFRIADGAESEILRISGRADFLEGRVRTNWARVRFRPALVREYCEITPGTNAVRVTATAWTVGLEAESPTGARCSVRRVRGPGSLWQVVWPFERGPRSKASILLADLTFSTLIFLPLGFFAVLGRLTNREWTVATLVTLAAGLVAAFFQQSTATAAEVVVGASAGILLGSSAARVLMRQDDGRPRSALLRGS
jgi:hypothetical protein